PLFPRRSPCAACSSSRKKRQVFEVLLVHDPLPSFIKWTGTVPTLRQPACGEVRPAGRDEGRAPRMEQMCSMKVLIRRGCIADIPVERAWEHLARVEAWPSWAKHIQSVTLEPPGKIAPSTVGVFHLANPLRSGWPGPKARFAMTEFAPKSSWKWVAKFLWLT